jgi:hypothetical protein
MLRTAKDAKKKKNIEDQREKLGVLGVLGGSKLISQNFPSPR